MSFIRGRRPSFLRGRRPSFLNRNNDRSRDEKRMTVTQPSIRSGGAASV